MTLPDWLPTGDNVMLYVGTRYLADGRSSDALVGFRTYTGLTELVGAAFV
jgi:hypothetical protein